MVAGPEGMAFAISGKLGHRPWASDYSAGRYIIWETPGDVAGTVTCSLKVPDERGHRKMSLTWTRISLADDDDSGNQAVGLAALSHWLQDIPELADCVTDERTAPGAGGNRVGEQGVPGDVLIISVDSDGILSGPALSLPARVTQPRESRPPR